MFIADPDWKLQHYRIEKIVKVLEEFENFYKKEKTMDKRDNITNIVIEGDGKKTVSLVASDNHGRVIETVSANCAPEDVYNFNIGAKLALDRLYEGYDMTPKPNRKPYNGKIFIRCGDECFILNNNHVYDVKNGTIRNKVGDAFRPTFPYIFEGMSEDELSLAIDKFVYYGARYCCGHKDEVLPRHYTAYFVNE